MRLVSLRLKLVGPFEDVTVSLADANGAPRPVTVLFGGDGTGKTSLLGALACTRPGYALPPLLPGRDRAPEGAVSFASAEWLLGEDDPERPHTLTVASPSAVLENETPDIASVRRREQAIFDRKAQGEGGFVFVAFSGARWFSRTPVMLTTPHKNVLRYDVRQPASFDDPTRADLGRETKQILAYAAIGKALAGSRAEHAHLTAFEEALARVLNVLLGPFGFRYDGVSAETLEPQGRDENGQAVAFDAFPRAAKHLAAFGAFVVRALAAAYPGADEPDAEEGLVAIDDIESQQDPAFLRAILPLLHRALPNVQWIVTTSSTALAMACGAGEVGELIALRTSSRGVEIGESILH